MKIVELNIQNIRGIRNIDLKPDEKNMVVFGPNGTGKSAIVDSVDFLLSGKITRLTGKGTGALSIKDHGCHVDCRDSLKDTVVRAKVKIGDKEIVLERSIHSPASLKIEPASEKDIVESHLKVANLGQHILSRREILHFITAEEGERSKEILELLDLSEIESIRIVFVKIANESERDFKKDEKSFEISKSEILALLSLKVFDEAECLKKINEARKVLGGKELEKLEEDKLKEGLSPHLSETKKEFLTKEQIENFISIAKGVIEKKDEVVEKEKKLVELIEAVQKESKLKQYSAYKKLFEAGITLISDNNECPLCGREWPEGELKSIIETRQKGFDVAKEKQEEINKLSSEISREIEVLRNALINLDKAKTQFGIEDEQKEKTALTELLKEWSDAMTSPLESVENDKWPKASLSDVFSNKAYEDDYFVSIKSALDKSGDELTKKQKNWEVLIKMEDKWKSYKDRKKALVEAEISKTRAASCKDYFERARDSVLESIYDAVKDGFDTYYKTIHSDDEGDFTSELKPDGAALKMEVDFYNRGKFPPHALHSEGHQDSMGLCLFLALNEYLTKNTISIIVLDDVVMSIDQNHRRDICKLLTTFFSDKQFIITTHDTAWAKQLKTEGIVSQKNMVHFLSWDIDIGPSYELDKDLWAKIDELLKKDDIPSAAHKLRREAECYFENVCDFFYAQIHYKGSRQWELGEYDSASISALKSFSEKAIKNFKKQGDEEKAADVEAFYDNAKKVIAKSQVEQWAINAEVHYNSWSDMTKNDFEPVVQSFKELFGLFQCDSCGKPLILERGVGEHKSKSLSCNCKKISWNVD